MLNMFLKYFVRSSIELNSQFMCLHKNVAVNLCVAMYLTSQRMGEPRINQYLVYSVYIDFPLIRKLTYSK
jgi:hypothetical protein